MRVLPKGNDRSWTRAHYYAINKVFRRLEYLNRKAINNAVDKAFMQSTVYGTGYFRFKMADNILR